ncbi:MAG: baseplate J/gp47 family protein, partial [Aggregatilineales bacterium]
VDQAAGRALAELQKPTRAVTAADYEALAFETPGVTLARVGVRPNLHPGFPCWDAPGVVTVIILPHLPAGRPEPSCETIRQVAAYLARRRIVGTRIEVVGPTYRTVAVQASVRACQGERPAALRERLIARLDAFFDPLIGGPEGGGWPFGRDVYRSEVLQLLDETPGVEHVISLELLGDDCEPGCGNVCIGPVELVDAGEHEITVIAWEEGRYG